MTTPSMRTFEDMKKEWNKVKQSFEVYGPMGMGYKPSEIADYWLQEIRQRDQALRSIVEGTELCQECKDKLNKHICHTRTQ